MSEHDRSAAPSAAANHYREFAPPPHLQPFLESLWLRSIAGHDPDRRILPDGRMDLIWIRGVGMLVAGPQSRFTERPDPVPLLAVGARFHPGAAPSLLRLPASEFLDGHVPLSSFEPGLARRLDERLEAAANPGEALAAMSHELGELLDAVPAPDPAMREAVRLLHRPSASVHDVAAEVYVSERQLRRRFMEGVGYGPKTLQRILRFHRFASDVEAHRGGLADAALAAGYSDQAHLTRESRRLAGLSPSELIKWIAR